MRSKRDTFQASQQQLHRLFGTYKLAPGFQIEITRDGDQLYAQATAQPRFPVYGKSETRFYFEVVEAEIEFELTDDIANSLTLHQNGRHRRVRIR